MAGKIVKTVMILVLCGLLAASALIGFVFYQETHLPPVGEYGAIIVLGAQVLPDGTPSVALERRMKAALESWKENECVIIACGAQAGKEPTTEGDVMRRWFIANGVPENLVIAETESYNTRQNLLNSQKIMKELGIEKALVVTSDYHVARALALCRQIGLDASGKGSPSKPEYFLKNHIREGLSWIKFLLEGVL